MSAHAGWLSLCVPGLGQWALGRRQRAGAILLAVLTALGLVAWQGQPRLALALIPFWALQTLDAHRLAHGAPARNGWLLVAAALPVYAVGWVATEIQPGLLVREYDNIQPLLRAFANPEVVCRVNTDTTVSVEVLTPCPTPPPAPAVPAGSGPALVAQPACSDLEATLTVTGTGFPPGQGVRLYWERSQGSRIPLAPATADAGGAFGVPVTVPADSVPLSMRNAAARSGTPFPVQHQQVVAIVPGPVGRPSLCEDFLLILESLAVTVALGFLATVLGALLALPLAVLAARNLMGANAFTRGVYGVVRMVLNVTRSIEPLIMAVVFVVWVGPGPFAGMLALTGHTMAALGKLFSEAIEDIDPGPVEAVRATGARWLQQVVFAVLPQVVPPFTAYTVYRWDINVRMSTVIGIVGGGGIGVLLTQWIATGQWPAAATAIYAIAAVVLVLDFVSAAARGRIEAGRPLMPPHGWGRAGAWLALLAITAWAWSTAQVDLVRLVQDAYKVRPIVRDLLHPNLLAYDVITDTARAELLIPCGALPPVTATATVTPTAGTSTAGLTLSAACAAVGDVLTATGTGFAPRAEVKLSWLFPDHASLPAGRTVADARGGFAAAVAVRPILGRQAALAGGSLTLAAQGSQPTGRPHLSAAALTTANLMVETLLLALMASTFGAVLALPLAFLAARNIVPDSRSGTTVYLATRSALNLLRAVEPLILAILFAVWVGFGSSFAGVLALTVVTVASLGKLFSEAVEHAEPGPMEAMWATGSRRLQMIAYGVIPQVLLAFLAFGIYHWDINVRMSTVVGFVGAGGIGTQLREWMATLQWRNAAVAILAIVIVVSAMDFLSARLREQLSDSAEPTAGVDRAREL